jgi:opacity protein-like surface antigen
MRPAIGLFRQVALCGIFILLAPLFAAAEWYVGGYGGYSWPQSLKDVTMNNFGFRNAVARNNFTQTDVTLGNTLTQNFQTSDVSLKSSAIFGGKAGYFFREEGFSWLGVEVEAFTTKPTIKQQTVNTTQGITFQLNPNTLPVFPCGPPNGKTCSYQETVHSTLNLSESSLRLIVVAFNVVARYPDKVFQPYIGVGVGAFYFSGSGQVDGHQVVPGLNVQAGLKVLMTEEWGFFAEGKYNLATINNLDENLGLSGQYSAFNAVAGLAYHF